MSSAGALLGIWHDVQPAATAEYVQWHTFEHLPERLAVPGFKRAARYARHSGPGQQVMCLIDVDSMEVFKSSAYLDRLNAPTDWTRRLMPHYENVHRALCHLRFEIGSGVAPYLCCIRFNLRPPLAPTDLPDSVTGCLTALHERMQIVRAQVGVTDAAVSAQRTEETRLRRTEGTGGHDFVLVASALQLAGARLARAALKDALGSLVDDMTASVYRLEYSAWAPHS